VCRRRAICGGVHIKTMIGEEPAACGSACTVGSAGYSSDDSVSLSFGSSVGDFSRSPSATIRGERRARAPAIETIIVLPRHNWTIASENTNYKQPGRPANADRRLFIGCQVVKSGLWSA